MMWKQQVAIELERQRSRRRSRNEEFGILEIEIPLLSNHHHDSSELTEEPTAKTNRHARLSRYHRQINQQTAPEPIEELSPDEEREDEASVCQTRDDEEGTDQKRDFDEDIDEHDSTQDELPAPDTQQPKQKSRNIFGFTKRKSSRRTSDKSANSPNQRSNNYSEPTKKLGKFARKRWEQFRSIGTRKRTGGKA